MTSPITPLNPNAVEPQFTALGYFVRLLGLWDSHRVYITKQGSNTVFYAVFGSVFNNDRWKATIYSPPPTDSGIDGGVKQVVDAHNKAHLLLNDGFVFHAVDKLPSNVEVIGTVTY